MSILDTSARPKISQLANGIRVATIPAASTVTTMGYWLKSGSIYENPETNGVSHYLEHIVMRGNKKFPQDKLETLAERRGINFMATTSRTTTCFHATVSDDAVDLAADALSSIVLDPQIEKSTVEDERETILAEENEVSHNMNEVIWDKLHEFSFSSSCAYPILGPRENIRGISSEMLRNHHNTFFHQNNLYFVAVTQLPHERIVSAVEKGTKWLKPPSQNQKAAQTAVPQTWNPRQGAFLLPLLKEPMIAVALQAPSISNDTEFVTAQVIKAGIGDLNPLSRSPLLGCPDAMSDLHSHYYPYGSTGIMAFFGSARDMRTSDWIGSIWSAFGTFLDRGIGEKALEIAKRAVKFSLLQGMTGTKAIADEVGIGLLLRGNAWSIDDYCRKIDAVSQHDINNYAAKYLDNAPFSATIITPEELKNE